jgi:hypothetical protein
LDEKKDLKELLGLSNRNKFRMNACGFFVVDRKLVVNVMILDNINYIESLENSNIF